MTVDEAIRLLDPKTTEQAVKEIKYYNGFNGKAAALEAFEDACVLAADALRTQRNSGWISVKERLPEDNGRYLVFLHEWSNGKFLPKYDDFKIRIMRFTNNGWSFPVCVDKRCEADTNRAISHWMPLPEPPKEVQP